MRKSAPRGPTSRDLFFAEGEGKRGREGGREGGNFCRSLALRMASAVTQDHADVGVTSIYVCVLYVCVCVHWQRSKVDAAADSSAPTDEDERKEQESGKPDAAADDA